MGNHWLAATVTLFLQALSYRKALVPVENKALLDNIGNSLVTVRQAQMSISKFMAQIKRRDEL